ncbi:hypothetical protein HPB50_002584 [Hyalomma asiaticum]|uniref:Uncharacterized protein n=1 Tax=Hyalomma asiaticum TaxID=266040 RepID=A0ACB7SFV9_HYAAI|nr:hypothetical protein HPB50_002584 [Hyalomma asiaticum]
MTAVFDRTLKFRDRQSRKRKWPPSEVARAFRRPHDSSASVADFTDGMESEDAALIRESDWEIECRRCK